MALSPQQLNDLIDRRNPSGLDGAAANKRLVEILHAIADSIGGIDAQVNSDWNSTYSVSQILNKPITGSFGLSLLALPTSNSFVSLVGLGTAATADVDQFATAAQGLLANTSIQPSDPRLTNARPASDIYSWAKTPVKPVYTYIEVGADPAGAAAAITLAGLGGITPAAVAAGYQPLDSDLTAIAALSTTTFGRALLTQADAAATRATIGAGTSSFSGAFSALSGIPTTLGGYGITDAQPINAKLTSIAVLANVSGWLYNDGTGAFAYSTPTKSDVGLANVENTALSTWAGSANLTTLGTISTGVWHGTAITDSYIASAGAWNAKQAAITFGTGVQTALGVNIGSAGAPVLFNGAIGTPTSGTLTNCTFPTLNQNTSGTAAGLSATLAVTSGGTGLATIASGKMLYASALNTFATLSTGDSLAITGGVLDTIQDIRSTANPTFGDLTLNTFLTVNGIFNGQTIKLTSATDNTGFVFENTATGGRNWRFYSTGGSSGYGQGKFVIENNTAGLNALIIDGSNNAEFYGSIKTASPSGGTAQPWKLGSYISGVVVVTGYTQVEINGVVYKLLTAT